MEIEIDLEGTRALARLDPESAPISCAALAALLPLETTAHYAKIAGDEFMLHLPVVLDVEHARPVAALPRGCVALWPERQLFCVYYGRIQEEDATVTVLGHVVENLDALAAAGDRLRRPPEDRPPMARVRAVTPPRAASLRRRVTPDTVCPAAAQVMAAYAAITDRRPAEVSALLEHRAVMRPIGPLLYAEAETRKLNETLWLVRLETRRAGTVPAFAEQVLRHGIGRMRGWYQLTEAAAVLEAAVDALLDLSAPDAVETLDALMVYIGRLSLWLDLSIPWSEFNRLLPAP